MRDGLTWKLREAFASRQPEKVAERQRARLAEIVTFARTNSLYYRELYRDLPERVEDVTLLPVTGKTKLMARFDDWVTDREVTIEKTRAFVDNPNLIGQRFLAKYTALTTSGTTGAPGIFLLDDRAMAVTTALMLRLLSAWLDFGDIVRIIAGRGRLAMVNAMGGHFASAVAATRLRRRRGNRVRVFPVHMPLQRMVAELNQFRPVLLAPYASFGALLASKQEAGHLRIKPVLLVLSAEGLPLREYDRIAHAFNAKVRHSYAATECAFISYSCEHKWLHVNSDWLALEAVDADYRPTPPGQESHTALVTNLANRVQPVLRYDIGDSVLQRPDPCPCGNPLPAIRVHGRTAEVLTFSTPNGEKVIIAPLVFVTLGDRIRGIELFQIVQTTPTSLRVRLHLGAGTDPDHVWEALHTEIRRLLNAHALEHIRVERAEEPPEPFPGGKYRRVVPLS